MNLLDCKNFLLKSGLASEAALLLGILSICIWTFIAPKSAFGIGFWIALLSLASAFFLAGFTPDSGDFYALRFDFWTGYIKKILVVSVSVALFGYLEWRNARTGRMKPEILIFLLLSQLSLSVLIQAKGLWLMFLAAECFSICSFAIARPLLPGKEAAASVLRYFASGALASSVGIFGLSWMVGFQGTNLGPSNDILLSTAFFPVAGAVFFLSFLLFKMGSFPFHFWVPGVYDQAPTPMAGYIASAPKLAAAFALLHLIEGLEANITLPLVLLALVGSLLGNLAALGSSGIKNMLSFSAIGQAGLLLIPAIFTRQISGAENHLLVFGVGYIVVVQASFSAVQYFENHLKDNLAVKDFSGQWFVHPLPSIVFIILVVSLIGLPPTIGFTGKLLLFSGILAGSNLFSEPILYLLFGIGIGNTVLSLGYFYKIPYFLIFRNRTMEDLAYRDSSASLLWMILVSFFALLAFFTPGTFFPLVKTL